MFRESITFSSIEIQESWSNDGSDDELEATTFPDFEAKVNETIASLGGAVFPKLNWSAPKDAAWINFGSTLRCTSATDLLVLLKASDFISHDIYAPFAFCTDVNDDEPRHPLKLVLRAWRQIRPDGELRCFIRSNQLYVINATDSLVDVMDVYVGHKFGSSRCVRVIDFNVYGPPTDGLMFNWSELRLLRHDKEVHFRWQSDKTMRSSVFSQYKLPIDLVDISSGDDPEKLLDLIKARAVSSLNQGEICLVRFLPAEVRNDACVIGLKRHVASVRANTRRLSAGGMDERDSSVWSGAAITSFVGLGALSFST
ncbi:unnamed protein product [Hydatigera taeniaeformis]|uniref:Cell division cycle protein 123 homolog n=1 Tax=Hydatigena taeniaeformis TaxID=6205 RepID=A0A0R3WRM8_HYDTA|nr:unnamed protein product [Hydatigera taeniaeformis]